MDDRMVEIAAMALFARDDGEHWEANDQPAKDWYRRDAYSALQALLDAGYTILPPGKGA